jgi:hypothetical protein
MHRNIVTVLKMATLLSRDARTAAEQLDRDGYFLYIEKMQSIIFYIMLFKHPHDVQRTS